MQLKAKQFTVKGLIFLMTWWGVLMGIMAFSQVSQTLADVGLVLFLLYSIAGAVCFLIGVHGDFWIWNIVIAKVFCVLLGASVYLVLTAMISVGVFVWVYSYGFKLTSYLLWPFVLISLLAVFRLGCEAFNNSDWISKHNRELDKGLEG